MIGKPGPFQIIESQGCGEVEAPIDPPRRRYDCPNYQVCLAVAVALNWDSFTCRGCCGEVEQSLFWRARQEQKKDTVVGKLCDFPSIKFHSPTPPDNTPGTDDDQPRLRVVGKD